tara:strand:+ start:356 stop:532 length:177 start_codon:yes stop_codon:yes gene_type:complete
MSDLTDRERLLFALTQVDNIVKLTEHNEWKNYLYNHLSPIKYELERQLSNLAESEQSK